MEEDIFSQEIIRSAVKGSQIVEKNLNRKGRNGLPELELGVIDKEQQRHIVVLRDLGSQVECEWIEVGTIASREERNAVISSLYHERGLTRKFLAKFFRLSLSAISGLVKEK